MLRAGVRQHPSLSPRRWYWGCFELRRQRHRALKQGQIVSMTVDTGGLPEFTYLTVPGNPAVTSCTFAPTMFGFGRLEYDHLCGHR